MAGNKLKEGMVGSLNYWKKQPGAHSVEHMALKGVGRGIWSSEGGFLPMVLKRNTMPFWIASMGHLSGKVRNVRIEKNFVSGLDLRGSSTSWSAPSILGLDLRGSSTSWSAPSILGLIQVKGGVERVGWENCFNGLVQSVLPRPSSDHALILQDGGGIKRDKMPFRYVTTNKVITLHQNGFWDAKKGKGSHHLKGEG
ncbi:hypothetical protein CK203_006760 [Vitis vinifera]|uniref:Uncharacterized protein n=1 Tax=Vitis vinifera TaxID=29760 RepID=A0A438KB53_VITVI|nr:hypothetical protein CK203_006760 [Vitis vinifera]